MISKNFSIVKKRPVAQTFKKSIGYKDPNEAVSDPTICEGCKRGTRRKKCQVCAKHVCSSCWSDVNQSCFECAEIE